MSAAVQLHKLPVGINMLRKPFHFRQDNITGGGLGEERRSLGTPVVMNTEAVYVILPHAFVDHGHGLLLKIPKFLSLRA